MKLIVKNIHLWMLALFTLASIFLSACQSEVSSSSLYRGDKHHTGFFETEGVPTLTGAKWQFETGCEIYATPVVDDGVVYITNLDGNLYAFH